MFRTVIQAHSVALLLALLPATPLPAAGRDLTFATEYPHEDVANFYFQGRAIGEGAATFQKILEEIEKLPEGSSVVWGPDYGKCPSCGNSVRCVPKALFPNLWARLEKAVATRNLRLRGVYPAPPMRGRIGEDDEFPLVSSLPSGETDRYDAVLHWEIANDVPDEDAPYKVTADYNGRSHVFSASGKILIDYQRELFFGKLPEKSRVLVRLILHESLVKDSSRESLTETIRCAREKWKTEFSEAVRIGKLQVTVGVEPTLQREFELAASTKPVRITWSNFHGANTPHSEVLYQWNGDYVGRGDHGIDVILRHLRALPTGLTLQMPRYEFAGRGFIENHGLEKIEAENVKLRRVLPFAARRSEIGDAIRERQLQIDWKLQTPRSLKPMTVRDWDGGDRYGQTFASFGRIVFHDETATPPAAVISWRNFDAAVRQNRDVESLAVYTLNDQEFGRGVEAFAKIVDQIQALPEGSTVHVAVCLQTEFELSCPITYQGLRHFERTGFEPYFGLFPWLVDVCEKRKLKLEWIPDQRTSYRDCIYAL